MRKLKKLKLSKVYDLQNSSRTNFYKRILFPNSDCYTWSSSITTLPSDNTKKEFDKKPVLDRFDHQLKTSGVNTKNTLSPNFTWSCDNIDDVIALIKASKNAEDARDNLIKTFKLSEIQSKAIVEMRLRQLTGLEQDKLRNEYEEIKKLIEDLKDILSDEKRRMNIILMS